MSPRFLPGSRGRYPYHDAKYLQVLLVREDIVFGDEAGTSARDSHVSVSGWMGSPRQWAAFDKQWKAALDAEGVEAFHSVDFFQTQRWQSRKSPYHGWEYERGKSFLERLLNIIERQRIAPVGGAVDVAAFNAQPLETRQYVTGGIYATVREPNGTTHSALVGTGAPERLPYTEALTLCVWDAAHRGNADTVINFIFDENKDNEWLAKRVIANIRNQTGDGDRSRKRLGDVTFAPDWRHPGIQAADMACYAWNRLKTAGSLRSEFHRMAWEVFERKGFNPRQLRSEVLDDLAIGLGRLSQ